VQFGAEGTNMSARYRIALAIVTVLAFLAIGGLVLRRRAEREARGTAASLQYLYKRDRQYRESEVMVVAAYQGDLNRIRRFLPDAIPGQMPNVVNSAVRADQTAIVAYLFDQGYLPDRLGNAPYLLSVAAAFGYTDLLRLMQRRHVSFAATDRQEALIWAAARGNADTVRLLLDMGADLNAPAGSQPVSSYADLTPLMVAANYGHTDVVRLLLARHADVNHKSPFGRTALTYARSRDLPPMSAPGAGFNGRVLPERASLNLAKVKRTDDPSAVVTLLRGAGGTE
jgi:hypothetical protein